MVCVISVSNLGKSYGRTVAVDDVSLEVFEGEIFGLIGPNGAGKTTTMECVEGNRVPDRGKISVLGLESKPSEERVGVYDAGVERPPEVHRLPHLDSLLELRLLVLHADPLAERVGIASRIEAEHGDGSLVGNAIALDALHRGRLARAVRTNEPEDLALEHLERDVVHRHGAAVALAQVGNGDDDPIGHP